MSITQAGPVYGQVLDSFVIETGLRELCPDLHFDLGGKHNQLHPFINQRQGVYYKGNHVCSMDRGMVPEFKLWTVKWAKVPVGWEDADKDDVSIQYRVVHPWEPEFMELYEKASKGNLPEYQLLDDGRLIHAHCVADRKVCDRVALVGWRHTFERLLHHQVPGITRESLAKKFGVDMWKYPVGGPTDLAAALLEE